jgi:uncharacterized protein YndB with AHSA1/START domain
VETATEDKTSLQIRRIYPQPVAAVYAAWSDPDQIKHWMGYVGEAEVTIDVRVGGRYRYIMQGPDGQVNRVGGVFREVVPNHKLVYTWAWESTPERESVVTVEFKPSGQGTELLVTHQRFADEQARDKHLQGWNGCLDRLGRYLAS